MTLWRRAPEAFGTHEKAALAHAYLSGFILQVVATERSESVEHAASRVRQLASIPYRQ